MKFKTTIILFVVFAIFLALVLVSDKKDKENKAAGSEEKLVTLAAADIQKMTFKKDGETLTFKKDDKGNWLIIEPMEVKADDSEVGPFADSFADLKIERVVEKENADLKKYEIPRKEVWLWLKGRETPVKVLIGMENPLDNTFFAQKEGDKRVVLIASSLKTMLEKKFFDFRQKDIFKFETGDVKSIHLVAKDVTWEARKNDEEWFIQSPFKALAKEGKISNLLDSLSNQKAKEFVAENKKPEDLKKSGLDKPEYQITLALPKSNKELTFAFHKANDKTYVTTSQSTKIIVPEIELLNDLEKKAEELRENKVVGFNAWQASKVVLKKGVLNLILAKAQNDKWYFDAEQKQEADASKVDTFIRKIESLESTEYIDPPKSLAEYGLDRPQAEVTVWTKETGEKAVEKTFGLLVGKSDKDKKQVVVKNVRLDYLFKVDNAFLDEFPKEAKDWKAPEPAKKEPDKKK
jgi:hypothetical protein